MLGENLPPGGFEGGVVQVRCIRFVATFSFNFTYEIHHQSFLLWRQGFDLFDDLGSTHSPKIPKTQGQARLQSASGVAARSGVSAERRAFGRR